MVVIGYVHLKGGPGGEASSDDWTHVDSWSTNPYAPTADFTYSPNSPEPNESIHFESKSEVSEGQMVEWNWNFGDGNTSTEENPTHSYSKESTYSVILKVFDDDGNKDMISKLVEVKSTEE